MSVVPAALVVLTGYALAVALLREHLPARVVRSAYLVAFVGPLVATAYAIAHLWHQWVGWREVSLFLGGYVVTGLGTTIGYHRLLAHRSFQTGPAVEAVLLVLGAMALPQRPVDFVAYHRKHHALADHDGDPHSPLDGLFHAHLGWVLGGRSTPEPERYARDVLDDPVAVFVSRTAFAWFGLGLLVPFAVAGWTGLLWGGLVRMALSTHATFAVNSICHTYGSRPFATRDRSTNNLLVGVVALGEGWHNNHHAFPGSAAHGIGWRQPDLGSVVIRLLARAGLATNVRGKPEALFGTRRAPAQTRPDRAGTARPS
jgi:stearoyl-CoA desaturase (Delta-9 desaturase)